MYGMCEVNETSGKETGDNFSSAFVTQKQNLTKELEIGCKS